MPPPHLYIRQALYFTPQFIADGACSIITFHWMGDYESDRPRFQVIRAVQAITEAEQGESLRLPVCWHFGPPPPRWGVGPAWVGAIGWQAVAFGEEDRTWAFRRLMYAKLWRLRRAYRLMTDTDLLAHGFMWQYEFGVYPDF